MKTLFLPRIILALIACAAWGCQFAGRSRIPAAHATMTPATLAAANDASDSGAQSDAVAWKTVTDQLGRQGTLHDDVYTVVIPRDDLYVTEEQMYVPTAAGIESRFNFYHCSCGKTSVVGEFVVTDYEANDVMATLLSRQFIVASLAPFLLHEHPRLLAIHFKGEGKSVEVSAALKEALSYTGKERDAPATRMAPDK